ncbi:NLP/P60 protein [Candidatus Vecturithrix granuli]|uniref:NLP/P60 protein n=1 Tax=Vecturithrix granuli TaxID=1499967 RepID=A0A081BY65_VECG1|nr:NLP/P60 protein [Candidatus Vecturithrix granuli]
MPMKHVCLSQDSYKRLFILFAILFFAGAGCHQTTTTSPRDSSQQRTSPFALSGRFGAINVTFADIYAEPLVTSERLTQCIYGDVVKVEQEKSWWYFVKVGPYPELKGWIHKSFVSVLPANALYLKERNLTTIVIRDERSEVFVWPSHSIILVMGTELPFIGESGEWYLVRLPNNDVGRIARHAVLPDAPIEKPLIHSKQESPPVVKQNIPRHRRDIITTAQKFVGKVYIWGGTTPRGFDCSGLTYFVYKLNGIELPRVSSLQFRNSIGKKIKKTELVHGDLVFFQTYRSGPSHVGIYIGNNQFIHASPKYGVTVSDLNEPYFKTRYIGAKTLFLSS